MKETKSKKGQSGQVTFEFLFAFAITFGVFLVIFSVMFTLSMVEITQYIVFSASRAHLAGNVDTQAHQDAARKKYEELLNHPALKNLYTNGWFSVSPADELDIRSGFDSTFAGELAGGDDQVGLFTGVSTKFVSQLMDMRVPFLGNTNEEEGSGFSSRINSILIREPSQKDCEQFFEQRRQAIGGLKASAAPYYQAEAYIPMEDNGC